MNPAPAALEHGGSHVTMLDVYDPAPRDYVAESDLQPIPCPAASGGGATRHLVRQPQLRPGVLEQIGVRCGAAGLFLLAIGIVTGMAFAVLVTAPYFLLRTRLPSRQSGGCSYCRAGLPPSRTSCPGCGAKAYVRI